KIDRPAGVTRDFQVRLYKVEPSEAVLACNLLAKNDCRTALLDEVEPGRPKMPLVSKSCSFACRAERLARATAGPCLISAIACLITRVVPHSDAGKEVHSVMSCEIVWSDVFNASFIHVTFSNPTFIHQIT